MSRRIALVLLLWLSGSLCASADVAWIDWGPRAELHGDTLWVDALYGTLHVDGVFDRVSVTAWQDAPNHRYSYGPLMEVYISQDGRAATYTPPGTYQIRIVARRGEHTWSWQQRIGIRG